MSKRALMACLWLFVACSSGGPSSNLDAGDDAGPVDSGPAMCGDVPADCGLDCSRFPYDCALHWQNEPLCAPICAAGHCCDCIIEGNQVNWRPEMITCFPSDAGSSSMDAGH